MDVRGVDWLSVMSVGMGIGDWVHECIHTYSFSKAVVGLSLLTGQRTLLSNEGTC